MNTQYHTWDRANGVVWTTKKPPGSGRLLVEQGVSSKKPASLRHAQPRHVQYHTGDTNEFADRVDSGLVEAAT